MLLDKVVAIAADGELPGAIDSDPVSPADVVGIIVVVILLPPSLRNSHDRDIASWGIAVAFAAGAITVNKSSRVVGIIVVVIPAAGIIVPFKAAGAMVVELPDEAGVVELTIGAAIETIVPFAVGDELELRP
uniref:Uncharacterized protein n=1 Tax=Ditylenchus dipsaci TaxID=166011 RepID=A0A915DGY5_9BILA